MALESGIFDQVEDIPAEILDMKPDEIRRRVRLLDSEIRVHRLYPSFPDIQLLSRFSTKSPVVWTSTKTK